MAIVRLFFRLLLGASAASSGFDAFGAGPVSLQQSDISFRNEVQRAIDRGILWLKQNQSTNGYWSTPDQPAVTALALAATQGNPALQSESKPPEWVAKG